MSLAPADEGNGGTEQHQEKGMKNYIQYEPLRMKREKRRTVLSTKSANTTADFKGEAVGGSE